MDFGLFGNCVIYFICTALGIWGLVGKRTFRTTLGYQELNLLGVNFVAVAWLTEKYACSYIYTGNIFRNHSRLQVGHRFAGVRARLKEDIQDALVYQELKGLIPVKVAWPTEKIFLLISRCIIFRNLSRPKFVHHFAGSEFIGKRIIRTTLSIAKGLNSWYSSFTLFTILQDGDSFERWHQGLP